MLPSSVLAWVLVAWFFALTVIVLYRLLTGRIPVDGLLSDGSERFSPARLQLLIMTIGGLVAYVTSALSTKNLPTIPDSLVGLFAASHAVYVGGKATGR
ncbi:hypothetical protein UAJ10_02170 [Nitrospirillum sp. BR 11164]|uniref:hypothetical protein n=1 Tax=Nitrospirillum sp. BR 11164 TaxID=3104324 RepID=UPI002AFEF98C|nr:hypothetical protein [Nitrospirillum sp. BR 11164]MEA1647825.1 hypothetical protein [Nitrospirillum sp. BR 11164]